MPTSSETVRASVSCVIGVYNGAKYLGEAIQSALDQTHSLLEVVVADDGSTDNTREIAEAMGQRVAYVYQENSGPASARNLGRRHASGEFVAFLDADDRWVPDKLARQLAEFEAEPELGACFGHARNFWVDELRLEAEAYKDHRISQPVPAYVSGTMVVRAGVFDEVGPFDESLPHADVHDWVLRARAQGVRVGLIEDVVLERRLHDQNRSRLRAETSRDTFLHLIKRTLDQRRES